MRTNTKARSGAGSVADALQDYNRQQHRQGGSRTRRRAWLASLSGGARWVLLCALAGFILLALDGCRREIDELRARVEASAGQVQVERPGSPAAPLKLPMQLAAGDALITGPRGAATLVFPEGTAVRVEPNTRFELRNADYSRRGGRDRCFVVRHGAVVVYVSQFAGAGSRASVVTPTAVATAHGTAFRVAYDPRTAQTGVAVAGGKVGLRTQGPEVVIPLGCVGQANGYALHGPQRLEPLPFQRLARVVRELRQYETPPGGVAVVEQRINRALDPFLSAIGLGGGWAFGASDGAGRTAAREALRQLGTLLLSGADEPPAVLNLLSLEPVQFPDPKRRDHLLRSFAGGMLESYRKVSSGQYAIRARARDSRRTLYELTPAGVVQVRE